jgi:hypothetical protein
MRRYDTRQTASPKIHKYSLDHRPAAALYRVFKGFGERTGGRTLGASGVVRRHYVDEQVPAMMNGRAGCSASGPVTALTSQCPARSASIVTMRRFALAFATSRGRRQPGAAGWSVCQLTGTSKRRYESKRPSMRAAYRLQVLITAACGANVSLLRLVDCSKQPQYCAC